MHTAPRWAAPLGSLSGHGVTSKQSPPYLSQGGLEQGPEAPHTLAQISLPRALPPCCFSICLITKQKFLSGLLYFCM